MAITNRKRSLPIAQIIHHATHEHHVSLPRRQLLHQPCPIHFGRRARPAVNPALLHAALARDRRDLALVALDEVEVAAGHERLDGVAAQLRRARADGVEQDGAAARVVGAERLHVVCEAVGRYGAHVYDEGAVEGGEVGGFGAVVGHYGTCTAGGEGVLLAEYREIELGGGVMCVSYMQRATLAAKFWTTRFVMLWQRGVSRPSFFTMAGIESRSCWTSLGFFAELVRAPKAGGVRIRVRSSEAACLGSWAPMMALTTATPSRALKVAFVW